MGVRLYAGPLEDRRLTVKMPDGMMPYRLISLPLYMAEELLGVFAPSGRPRPDPARR